MNIYQRVNEVRKKVHYVRKDKKVGEGGGYMAVTHDAVTALAREHLIEQGVVIVPTLVGSQCVLTGTMTAKGIPFIRYEAKYRFNVVNADDPQDSFSLDIESHAMDQGDKAPGKALSYAKKYAVLKLLEIESGEEEEEREFQKPDKVTPNSGAMERLTKEEKARVEEAASSIIDCFEANMPDEAFKVYDEIKSDVEKLGVWSFLDSKMRRSIKNTGEARRKGGNGV